jgi:hypothetical protein
MSRLLAFSLLLMVSAAMFVGCEKKADTPAAKTTTTETRRDGKSADLRFSKEQTTWSLLLFLSRLVAESLVAPSSDPADSYHAFEWTQKY